MLCGGDNNNECVTGEVLYAPEPSSLPALRGLKQLALGGGHALALF